jgi:acetyl esterase/lipase
MRIRCCFTLLLTYSVSAVAGDELPFVRHTIDATNPNSSCAVVDVDADGDLDIVAGGHWYAAPQWQRYAVREVEVIRGRQDNYSSLPLDVDLDGVVDLVSANYRSESLYWVRNPGPAAALQGAVWERTVIERPGPMETGRLFDIDDDGSLDVLPNGMEFASWWSLRAGAVPVWERHPLPQELAGHGVGFGDIDGDGRGDIVGPHGWAAAPADRRRDRWVFHPEFSLGKDASIPIVVLDVDGDGDSDIVWGRGHQIGVCWLEQISAASGQRQWLRHVIDSQSGQNHSLLIGDLDGNGQVEVITGARDRGHNGSDIGEWAPLEIAAYEFVLEQRAWRKRLVSRGDAAALGVDPKLEDLDRDGDADLVMADQRGVYWLENRRVAASDTLPEGAVAAVEESSIEATTYVHTDAMTVISKGERQAVSSAFLAALRREHTLAGISLAMGPLPSSLRRCPLEPEVLSEVDRGAYIERRISFAAEPGDRVPALLLLPKNLQSPTPAMLCLHQTTGIGKGEPAGLGGLPNLHYAKELAEDGFVCLAPDYPSFGDYPYDFAVKGMAAGYASGSMKAIWNNLRAVDLLQSLPEVDPDRIGCIGHSLGGHNSLFTAAFDQRLKAVVTSCGFTGFHDYYEGKLGGWTSDRYMPRIREVYGNDPDRVPFDFQEVLGAIAPRAVFVSAPLQDGNFDNAGVRKVMQEAARVYAVYGAAEATLRAEYPECGHDFPPEVRQQVREWLKERLRLKK